MRIVVTTTLNDNLFHAKLIPLIDSRPDIELVVVSDRQGPEHPRIKWVWPSGRWARLGRLGGRLPLLAREVFHPRTQLVMAYSLVPHGLFAVSFAKIRRVPVYLHFIAGPAEIEFAHNVEVSDNRVILASRNPRRLERLARKFALRANKVFVPGTRTREFLMSRGFDSSRIITLHSTIDPAKYYPSSASRDIDVLVAAQLRERKRPIFTLEVFRKILDARPGTRFCWLGDGGMHTEFEAALRRLDLMESVIWKQTSAVADYYRRAKVFLLCSINEGLSLASMEAMACGMVAVTSDCGDMADTVRTGQTGHLLPVDATQEEFAGAVLSNLRDDGKWNMLSQNSVRLVDQEHSFRTAEIAWREILERVERGDA